MAKSGFCFGFADIYEQKHPLVLANAPCAKRPEAAAAFSAERYGDRAFLFMQGFDRVARNPFLLILFLDEPFRQNTRSWQLPPFIVMLRV